MLKNKANGKKGFTLAELLIVVAIIGILVAISFPILTAQLEKSRKSTDDANLRSAKSAAAVLALDTTQAAGTYLYDADKGTLVPASPDPNITGYGQSEAHKGDIIKVIIAADREITVGWKNDLTSAPTPTPSS